jgi:hypothetical protein
MQRISRRTSRTTRDIPSLIRSIAILSNHPRNPCVLIFNPFFLPAICPCVECDDASQSLSVIDRDSLVLCHESRGDLLPSDTSPTVVPLPTTDATPTTTPDDDRHNIPVNHIAPTFWALSRERPLVPLIASATQLMLVPAHHLIVVIVQVIPANRAHIFCHLIGVNC